MRNRNINTGFRVRVCSLERSLEKIDLVNQKLGQGVKRKQYTIWSHIVTDLTSFAQMMVHLRTNFGIQLTWRCE
ncbi:MAG: hypothetical protein RLZZ70_215 [Candidatus Parcubacteria bacterium]|jgi:hypothetical protein